MNLIFLTRYFFPIFIIATMFFSGCAQKNGKYIRDSKEYGNIADNFEDSWRNYYARGRSFSEGKFYKEAITNFKKAVDDKEKDEWHAITLEKDFVDYFPHRELGVVYFKREEYTSAISELESSIQSAPSAKAHYFLNKARAAKIRLEESDSSPPDIHIKGIQGKRTTNDFTHTIKGVAVDDTFVASIQIGDTHFPIKLVARQQIFSTEIQLKEGENVVPIIATDLSGKKAEHVLEIFSDRSGPLVEILHVENKGDTKIVRGVVSDDGGLASLTINGRPWKISGAFSAYNFTFAATNEKTVLVATDKTGNITKATLSDKELEKTSLTSRDALLEPDSTLHPFVKKFFDSQQPMPASQLPAPTDSDPPTLKLKGVDTNQVTYKDQFILEYIIEDNSPIHSISIDGEPISIKNGNKLFFTQFKKLDEGKNEFQLDSIDIHGNESAKKIEIERKIKNIHKIDFRMSVSVLLLSQEEEPSPVAKVIHDELINSLVEQKRFNVVKTREIESAQNKLKFSNITLDNLSQIAEQGRIAAVNAVLAFTLNESEGTLEIIARLIDTKTETILASNDIFKVDDDAQTLKQLSKSLALRFKKDLPVVEGILTEVLENDEVIINIGSDKNIKPNLQLICYRESINFKHPVTGEILGAEPDIIAHLTVKEVFENFSKAVLKQKKEPVRQYDRIISR